MARPTSKTDLMQASAVNWQKLNDFVAGMTEAELSTPFDFSADEKKKEAHWRSGLFCPRPTTGKPTAK